MFGEEGIFDDGGIGMVVESCFSLGGIGAG